MKNHFYRYLNVREMLLTYRPRNFVELGSLDGENTAQLIKLRKEEYPFRLLTITTGDIGTAFYEVREGNGKYDFEWINGVSYEQIPKLLDGSIEFCSIDTHHTSEVLQKELDALFPKLFPRCIIVFHDTVSFPELRTVIEKFIKEHEGFIILRETKESCGAMAISRLLNVGYTQ